MPTGPTISSRIASSGRSASAACGCRPDRCRPGCSRCCSTSTATRRGSDRRRGDHVPLDAMVVEPSTPAPQPGRLALAEMARAIDVLPAEQREALLLVVLEGMSYAEAARDPRDPRRHTDVAPGARPRRAARHDRVPRGTETEDCEMTAAQPTPSPRTILHAYADGQLTAAERAAVEAWLAAHPDAARRGRGLAAPERGAQRALRPVAKEPIPARLGPQLHRRPAPARGCGLAAACRRSGRAGRDRRLRSAGSAATSSSPQTPRATC